ncbi:hypothetical protein V6Z11_D03G194300 [Gossypium hirsutum]
MWSVDSWILEVGPLFSYFPAHASLGLESTLRDWVLLDGSWKVDLLCIWLLDDVIKCIRVCLFLWFVVKQRLLNNLECVKRGIGQNIVCSLCGHDTEDIMHVLRDCLMARKAWKLVIFLKMQSKFFFNPFKIGFPLNVCCHFTCSSLFGLIAWRIWKNMNLFIFQNINWMAYEIVKVSLNWAQQFKPFLNEAKPNSPNSKTHSYYKGNWVYLFSDGAMARASGNASMGGVVRD